MFSRLKLISLLHFLNFTFRCFLVFFFWHVLHKFTEKFLSLEEHMRQGRGRWVNTGRLSKITNIFLQFHFFKQVNFAWSVYGHGAVYCSAQLLLHLTQCVHFVCSLS